MTSNILKYPSRNSVYSIWCPVCHICVSWEGKPKQNGWLQMYPWFYQAMHAHTENCNGVFEMKEDVGIE